MSQHNKLPLSLFMMRFSIFLVLLMWTLDKLIRPEHAAAVFERFYGLSGFIGPAMTLLAVFE
ncbi:MAG: hypothetical protein Q8L68_01340, partial [Methylococcales bacterium]|nr:hypothetical protein [Methylococcales bacterium]